MPPTYLDASSAFYSDPPALVKCPACGALVDASDTAGHTAFHERIGDPVPEDQVLPAG